MQIIRKFTSGWVAWFIISLIIFGMVFFGIESYFQTRVDTYAAKISAPPAWWRDAPSEGAMGRLARSFFWETHEISEQEFRERFDRYRMQVRAQAGDAYDAEQVESLETKRLVLDAMIDEKVLELASTRDGIAIDAATVKRSILEVDGITRDGEFIGEEAYLIWLQSRGLTAAGFEAQVARQLLVSKKHSVVGESGFVGDAELETLLKLQQETRDLRFLEVPLPVLDEIAADDPAVAEWHAANAARYSTAETVTISYVELDAAALVVDAEPSEDDLRRRYEDQRARFGSAEERSAAHILIAVAADADPAAVEAARVKALGIAEQARAESADFTALAATYSDDFGTRGAGGDLGVIARDVFPKPFEDAVFALEEGAVSDPVRTDEGWHVVRLTALLAGTQQPFEAVRELLVAEYLDTERERLFFERSGALVDAILREPNALSAVAAEMGLEVRTSTAFSRDMGDGIAALEPVRATAFSRPQKDDRQVSDPIEVSPNHVVVLQVTAHEPAALRPLDEVRDRVLADLQADRLAKAARERANALLERARGGESLDALATELGGVVQNSVGVARQAGFPDPAIATEAFRLLPIEADKPADVGLASLGGGRFALVVVTQVTPGDVSTLPPDVRSQLRAQLAQLRGEAERAAFVVALRSQFEVTVAEARL